MNTNDIGSHVTDDVLFGRGAPGDWPEDLRQHVASCHDCARKLAELSGDSELARELLHVMDAAPPVVEAHAERFRHFAYSVPAGRRPWYGPLAAGIGIGLLTALSVAPVRAWMLKSWRSIVNPPTTIVDGARDETPLSPAATLAFVPGGDELTVAFDHWQADGVLRLEAGDGSEASLRILTGSQSDNVLVTGSGIRIRNERESRTSYSLVVPTGVRIVRISVWRQFENTIPITRLIDGPVDASLRRQ